jgi:hypothetical protein
MHCVGDWAMTGSHAAGVCLLPISRVIVPREERNVANDARRNVDKHVASSQDGPARRFSRKAGGSKERAPEVLKHL